MGKKAWLCIARTCATCRFDWERPATRNESGDGGCARQDEIDTLAELRGLETVEWGATEACPLWESRPVSLCPQHGPFPGDDCCYVCLVPEE
jgi:hypothetical protein